MGRTRIVALVVLLLSYGAVGARQPAVRTSVPLGVPAARLAATLDIADPDRSRILLDVVRIVFDSPDGQDAGDAVLRRQVADLFLGANSDARDTVPLPLDPSVWRDTILRRQVPDNQLIAAILSERRTALLYHGLAGLDDETLAALGPDRETLDGLRRHAGAFATFGRSLRIHAGRVVVPGGADAEPLWQEMVGVEPSNPTAFVRRLFSGDSGRLAFFFDALSHLDLPHQMFATGRHLPGASQLERMRALLDVFDQTSPEWRPDDRPFMRPPFDPAITLSLIGVTPAGTLVAPLPRRLWTRIFRGDDTLDPPFVPITPADLAGDEDEAPVDAAWIVSRVHRSVPAIGRHRLETLLFAQRTLGGVADDEAAAATALRGFVAFPALALALERIGTASPAVLIPAAERARALNEIRDDDSRRTSIALFQSTLGILDRMAQNKGLAAEDLARLVGSLVAIDSAPDGYAARIASWLRQDLTIRLPAAIDTPAPLEEGILRAMAGLARPSAVARADVRIVQWEGRTYRVDPAAAEQQRLRQVRQRQGGSTLDAALETAGQLSAPAGVQSGGRLAVRDARVRAEHALADTLTSILYAAYLGDPGGTALIGGNVAARHELGLSASTPPQLSGPWRLPIEEFGSHGGWRISGSLLGLDLAMARLALRRLDTSTMPPESRLGRTERQTAALTAALLNPHQMTDAARDEIAAAIGRGRARLAALSANRDDVERVALTAGLSEWRREALAWTLTQDPGRTTTALSLVELLWLGSPRPSAAAPLDPWGAATFPLTGCACLQMPRARPWEDLTGRPAQGIMATRGADIPLLVAEALAARKLPAALAPAVVGLAMQDALDAARPAYLDDWSGFTRAAAALPAAKLDDYIAALAATGPLVALPRSEQRPGRQ